MYIDIFSKLSTPNFTLIDRYIDKNIDIHIPSFQPGKAIGEYAKSIIPPVTHHFTITTAAELYNHGKRVAMFLFKSKESDG